ncbi:hypothetical protein E0H86_02135 [Acinetobacter sp. ANC 4635]|uniref:AbiH family protein n=1 Tax=Acinetobacter sp. ANC 4635 TaxID=2529846 RepID=UPI00103CF25C|nr:AbiH family protein [Acinetobacter sp. ANC 4635]TCB33452.1 hypothetical protein E0H86_02135 [Acinetobacter sp. ANC 4635]
MNILIVGNGFDLSHYLPTKYDHFMKVMGAIENWQEFEREMDFDDLFKELYEKENYFFSYTKAIYKTEDIKIPVDQIQKLKEQLKENVWYQYFSEHVKEVKTWIDFETKIEEGLVGITKFIKIVEAEYEKWGFLFQDIECLKAKNISNEKKIYCISEFNFSILKILNLCADNPNYNKSTSGFVDNRLGKINAKWFKVEGNPLYGFSIEKYIGFLNKQLEDFIKLFNFYLEEIVKKLKPKKQFNPLKSSKYDLTEIDQIYSFNYTQTYLDFYNSKTKIDFLHGRSGQKQNMVLGISELKSKQLKKIRAYGFTKYHQKLMKDTTYLFLNYFKIKVNQHKKRIEYFEKDFGDSDPLAKKLERQKIMEDESKLNLKFYIWVHSLDVSDQEYIVDLFSLNDDIDRNVRVIIFYFDRTAKFSLLANLLHILGKEKVEHWMKQDWLKFEPNPEVAQLNKIQSVELA